MSAKPERITVNWLQKEGACAKQRRLFEQVFPNGAHCTVEDAEKAAGAGLDVVWAYLRLVDDRTRREFIRFTLQQRQPHLVALFEQAGLPDEAKAIAALDWADMAEAERVLTAAKRRAWQSAAAVAGKAPVVATATALAAAADALATATAAAIVAAADAVATATALAAAALAAADAAAAEVAADAAAEAADAAWAAARREQYLWLLARINEAE